MKPLHNACFATAVIMFVGIAAAPSAQAKSANWLLTCGQRDSLTVGSSPRDRRNFVQYNITLVERGRYALTF